LHQNSCSILAFGIISPWLLLGGVLLSTAPIVIHLLHRRRYQDRPWAAMQFLRAAVRKQARRVRMESLLLLAVRVLLVVAAACAVAQPFFTTPAADVAPGGGRMHHLLVIDASLSMQAGGEDSAFNRAREAARRIIDSADAGDAYHLLCLGQSSLPVIIGEATFDRGTIERELEALSPTEERGDVLITLRRAIAILKSSTPEHHWSVYILSDFQRVDWLASQADARNETRDLLAEIAARFDLNLVDVGAADPGNVAVIDAQLLRTTSAAGDTEIEAAIRAFGSDAGGEIPVELRIDGRLRETRVVSVPPRSTATVRFPAVLSGGEESVAEIRLPQDVLQPDNHRWLILPALEPLDVLIVSGEPSAPGRRRAADFLATALAPGASSADHTSSVERPGPMRPIIIPDAELATRDLAAFDCVVLCDVALISRGEAARLLSFVEAGGGLVIALGENVRATSYHEMLGQQGNRLLPARLIEIVASAEDEDGFRFDPADYAEAVVRPFAGNEDAGLLTTRIDRYYRVEPLLAARVLLRFSNDDPAIVELPVGAGRALLVSTALDDHWGNWSLWPSFLPMMHELVRLAGEADLHGRSLLVGDSIIHRQLPDDYGQPVVFVSPGTEPVPLLRTPPELETFSTGPVHDSGPCELRIGATAPTTEHYAVNVDTRESDLAPLGQALIASELLKDARYHYRLDWTQSGNPPLGDRLGRADLTLWFVLATLALLLVEQFMAWNFRVGAGVLALIVVAALVTGAGFRGLLGAALLLALVLVLVARRRRSAARLMDR
jgi:hypothetical protein